jgi:GntR family transcriptional regulator
MLNDFVISQTDGRPLYLQIMEQIKQKIAVGDWEQGQELPSIRQLAIDLMVSVITVKRAYFELEREGVILTQQGRASTVAASAELGSRICEQELQQHLAAAVRLAIKLGLTPEQLVSELMRASLVMPAEELEIEQ